MTMQVRLSKEMHKYITEEAERLAIAKNAVIVQMLDESLKVRSQSDKETSPCSLS